MNSARRDGIYSKFTHLVILALSGQAKTSVTIVVCSVIAVLLLAYVAAQIFSGVLMDEISQLKQAKLSQKETLNRLTSDYVSVSSRERVTHYCETVLHMVQAEASDFERFAVKDGGAAAGAVFAYSDRTAILRQPIGSTIHGMSEVIRR